MRRDPGGRLGARERDPEGVVAHAGPLEMQRSVDLGRADERAVELGGTTVEAPTIGRRDARVDGIAQERVTKVEVALFEVLERKENARVNQLLERLVEVRARS